MKTLILAALTAGTLAVAMVPSTSYAGVSVGIGVGVRDGGGWHRWHHHRQHCRWVPVWRHHHKMMIQRCGWGGDGMHGEMHMGY